MGDAWDAEGKGWEGREGDGKGKGGNGES